MVRIRFDLGLECVARNLQLHRLVLLPISSSVSSSLLYRWQLNFEPLRRARVVGACDLCFMARPRPRSRQHSFFVQAGATSLEPGCACCQFLIAFPLSGPQLNYWCRSERAHGTSISSKNSLWTGCICAWWKDPCKPNCKCCRLWCVSHLGVLEVSHFCHTLATVQWVF